jgi:hypothetical protein
MLYDCHTIKSSKNRHFDQQILVKKKNKVLIFTITPS